MEKFTLMTNLKLSTNMEVSLGFCTIPIGNAWDVIYNRATNNNIIVLSLHVYGPQVRMMLIKLYATQLL